MADLERLTVLIEANTRQITRQLKTLEGDINKSMRASARSVNTLNKSLETATRTAKTFASAFGLGFLTGGLAQLPDVLKSVAGIGEAADKIGITAEQLQELNFQAEQTGSSAEAMTESLVQFSKRLGEARTGTGDLYKLLKANGVALDDLAKMDVNEALRVFVDILGRAEDQSAALKMATIAGGKAATDWALTFDGGTAAMKAFAQQAHDTAQIISNETVKSADELDDKFQIVLGTILQIVKSGIVEAFSEIADEIDRIVGIIEDLESHAARVRSQPNPFNATVEEFEEYAKVGQRIDEAFDTIGKAQRDAELRRALQRRLSVAPGGDEGLGKPSVLPPPPPPKKTDVDRERDRAAAAIEREKKQVIELIAELEREQSLIGATDTERRISNELRDAGAVATEAQKQQIIALVTSIEAEEKALDDLINRMDTLRDAAGSAMDSFVQSIANAEGPLQAMKAALVDILQTIIRIAEQQAIARLFGAAGTAGGGLFGAAAAAVAPRIGSVAPARAAAPASTNVHITAEPSPLLNLTITKSSQAAEERAIARGPVVARNNQMRYGIA